MTPFSIAFLITRRALAALAIAVAGAFTEGVGVLLIIPLLGSIGLAIDGGPASGIAAAIDASFAAVGLRPSLVSVLAVFLVVSTAHAVLYRACLMLNPVLEQEFGIALRTRLYSAIARAEWSFLVRQRMNDLVHAVTNEADRTTAAAYQFFTLLAGLLVSAVYVAIAFRLSPGLTTIVAIGGAGVLWVVRGRTGQSADLGEKYLEASRQQFNATAESLNSLKVTRSLGAAGRDLAMFTALARARMDAYLELMRSFARSKMALDIAAAGLVCLLLFAAVEVFAVTGADLLVLVYVYSRIMPRVMSLQASAQTLAASLPSFRQLLRLIEECEAHAEPAETTSRAGAVRYEIRLEDVSYSYPGQSQPTLDRVNLWIPAGRTTAIVGVSGAGKSTLADVLTGLLRPTSGTVTIDGTPLDDTVVQPWRRAIGYVPQDGFLLHDTVRRNLLWAREDATEAEMWNALDRAAAGDFVRARSEGLDTIVGDRGVRLSGGERQRLALARALLTVPHLLVLDEATSALDPLNEQMILEAVHRLDGSTTTVLITHRLSAIRHADVIHVIENGRVVESGTWPALHARGSVFASQLAAV